MLSLAHCKNMLEQSGKEFTNQEVTEIRELFYKFAEMEVDSFIARKTESTQSPSSVTEPLPQALSAE